MLQGYVTCCIHVSRVFAQLRALVQRNPAALPQILEQIGQSDPAMLRLIRDVSCKEKNAAPARLVNSLSASLFDSPIR